jgi:hypothetical protein
VQRDQATVQLLHSLPRGPSAAINPKIEQMSQLRDRNSDFLEVLERGKHR